MSPEYLDIKRWTHRRRAGPFTEEDVERASNVCLIGQTVKQQLFGDEDPDGEVVRIAGNRFGSSASSRPKGQSATGQDQDDTIVDPVHDRA